MVQIVFPALLMNALTVTQQALVAHASAAIFQTPTKIIALLAQFPTVSFVTQSVHATNVPADTLL